MSNNLEVTRNQAEEAVKILLRYVGEDPDREGLKETPARVVRAYDELLSGYRVDEKAVLAKTFEDIPYNDDLVIVKDIRFASFCEHHLLPFVGKAHVAYLPNGKLVGISKLARLVDVFAKRLQTQENLTDQVLQAMETNIKPFGAAVMITARHYCMSIRGTKKHDAETMTSRFSGKFKTETSLKEDFYRLVRM